MKQEIVTYLSTIKDLLYDLTKYIYDNPEKSFYEYKSSKYISNILVENGFNVTENSLLIPTAFYAEYGSGHPKICFICEYDALENKGHIVGNNLESAMSVGAALSLSKVIDRIGGSVVVVGCPGELIGGSKITMVKQGLLKDIDVVLMAHPHITTAESGTSSALLPLSIRYNNQNNTNYFKKDGYTALDACIFTFTSINMLSKGFPSDIVLDGVISNGGVNPASLPNKTESKFYIKASSINSLQIVEDKIKYLVKAISYIMNLNGEVTYYEPPCEQLNTNKALSRIFCHNLKENGIIDCEGIMDNSGGLSLGNVSHTVPCIHPYINIIEDSSIKYSTPAFAEATLSSFAQNRMLGTAQSLAITALDLIQKEELLNEVRNEFYNIKNEKR